MTRVIESEPAIEIRREEVAALDGERTWIIASGPLTSDALATEIARITGAERLFFYDSISPIVDTDSIDNAVAFRASRYGKSLDGTDDYLNCPFDKPQYEAFLDALLAADSVPAHIDEDRARPLLRSLSSHRRNCASRTRHFAFRPDETDGIERPSHG